MMGYVVARRLNGRLVEGHLPRGHLILSGYLDFTLIEEVVEPNKLVLEIKLKIGEPSFCINRRSWKIESTCFYQKNSRPNDPATK
jgi:hypothetical protein